MIINIITIIISRRSNPRRVVQINTGRRLPPQDCRQRHSRQTTKVIIVIKTINSIVIIVTLKAKQCKYYYITLILLKNMEHIFS